MITMMTGESYSRKSKKLKPAAEPIMMLGGSPIKVAVPPMLEARISTMKKGMGLMSSRRRQTVYVTGPMRRTVVTLSRKAEQTAVMMEKTIMINQGLPLTIFADLMAMYSKMPEALIMPTNIIMPTKTPRVPKSMDSMPPSNVTMPKSISTTAPDRAATVRCIFSDTTRAITTTKTTIEMICAVVITYFASRGLQVITEV